MRPKALCLLGGAPSSSGEAIYVGPKHRAGAMQAEELAFDFLKCLQIAKLDDGRRLGHVIIAAKTKLRLEREEEHLSRHATQ
jgi:hypothetical protein